MAEAAAASPAAARSSPVAVRPSKLSPCSPASVLYFQPGVPLQKRPPVKSASPLRRSCHRRTLSDPGEGGRCIMRRVILSRVIDDEPTADWMLHQERRRQASVRQAEYQKRGRSPLSSKESSRCASPAMGGA